MMKQRSFAESGFERSGKLTKRERFLAEMDVAVPWARLIALIEPVHPKLGPRGGRMPFAAQTMLRIHFMQLWFNLSDPGMEDALHDIPVMRAFAGLDAGDDALPDESSILRFRHRLEKHDLAVRLLAEVNAVLQERGLLLRQGTIVDATLIAAPSSTKNAEGKRDPEMHQTKKGNQWYFGMKAHIGVDAESGLTHSVLTTSANVNDVTQAHGLLHGEEHSVFADAGYQGVDKRQENRDTDITWHVAMKAGKRKALRDTPWGRLLDKAEQAKASMRAKVEHPFRIVKRQFGYAKTRYRGLAKNTVRLVTLFALANLYQVRRPMAVAGEVRP
jgi:IS5 family transposase